MMSNLTFGQWVKRRRKALDWTQMELAQQTPCGVGTVRRLESDTLRPSRQLAERLAEVLQVPDEQHVLFVAFARNVADADLDLPPITTMPPIPIPPRTDQPALPVAPNPLIGAIAQLQPTGAAGR